MGMQKWFAPLFIVGLLLAGCIAPVTLEAPEDTPMPGEEPAQEQPAATHITPTTSCVVVLPNLRVVACDEAIPPVTHAERDTACMSIVPFDGRMAAVIASNPALGVCAWTMAGLFLRKALHSPNSEARSARGRMRRAIGSGQTGTPTAA